MIEIKTTRQQLHDIIDTLDDDSVKRIFHYVEDEMESDLEFTEEFQAELDRRWENYKNGGKTYTQEEVDKKIEDLLKGDRK